MSTRIVGFPSQAKTQFQAFYDKMWPLITAFVGTPSLLGSSSGVNMQTGGAVTLYTTPADKTTCITHAVIRDISGSLLGGTSYTITGLRAAFSLNAILSGGGTSSCIVRALDVTEQIEVAASTAVQFTPTTGSVGAATATIDIFGYTR